MAPLIETLRFESLKNLASERFGPITSPEEEILRLSATTEMAYPDELQERPEITGEFLRWLATDSEAAAHIDPLGLRVNNCTIISALNLTGSKLPFRLLFQHCNFQSEVNLRSAVLPELFFYNCTTEQGISADGLDSPGRIFLRNLRSAGEISFVGAQVGGQLDCSGTSLTAEGEALSADGAHISGDVLLREGFSSKGPIRFRGAQIGGDLDCSGASLTAEGEALSADGAKISGNVFLSEGFSAKGAIRFNSTQIGGHLDCSQAAIRYLSCEFAHLDGSLIWRALVEPDQSYLNLLGATIGTLEDDTASWPAPGQLVIKGCEYRNLTHHEPSTEEHLKTRRLATQRQLDVRERIQWLMLQRDENRRDPHAWMWLAKLFKEKDDIAGYRRIICEYRSLKARASKNPFRRKLGLLLAEIERNPWTIFIVFLPLLLLGTAIFWSSAHHMPPTNSDASRAWASGTAYPAAYPRFNPLVYTLENELPLIKFGMDDKWAPDPNLSTQGRSGLYWFLVCFRWFLIAAGWVQGILLTVGINRRFRD